MVQLISLLVDHRQQSVSSTFAAATSVTTGRLRGTLVVCAGEMNFEEMVDLLVTWTDFEAFVLFRVGFFVSDYSEDGEHV